jgi:chromatin modification-related protein VID21
MRSSTTPNGRSRSLVWTLSRDGARMELCWTSMNRSSWTTMISKSKHSASFAGSSVCCILIICACRGLLFKESTLPKFLPPPPIVHAPEPVEQDIAAPIKTPALLRAQPSQSPSPAPAPSTIAPIVAAPKVTHLPSPPETQAHAPPPALLQGVAPAPSTPPQEGAPKQLPVPSPPSLRQVTPIATLEVRTNGHIQEAVSPAPSEEQRKPVLEESRTIPSTPSPQPLSQPPASSPSPSPSPSVEQKAEDHAAPVAKIDGVPVVKGTTTEIPNEREKAAGVHVPPVPPELDGETHMSMSETESEAPPSPPVPPKKSAPTPKKRSPPPPPLALEIPDSQPSSIKGAASPPPSLGTPPTPPQTSQLSPPARLAVVTDHPPRRTPVPSEKEAQLEISSPASSIAASTPDNIISSATSPDAHQIPEPSKPATVVVEDHGKTVEERPQEEEVVVEQEVVKVAEKPEEPTLPSAAVADEIVEQEEEEEISLPTILSKELPRGSPAQVEEYKARELPRPIETEAAAPSSPVTESPVSPDPSAQLRLENQLANGVTRTLPPVPEEHAAALEQAKSLVASPKEQPLAPSPKPEPVHVPSSPVEAPIADEEEEEEEDRVQLVENRTPVVEKLASPVPELPMSAPEPKPQEEQKSVAKEPSPAPPVEEELEKELQVEAPAKPQPVVEEAPKEPEPEPSIPVPVEAEVEAPPAPPSPKPHVEGMPDSLLIPVDKESEGEEEEEEDIVMKDVFPPPTEPTPVVQKQATPEAVQSEILDERIAKSPKLPEKPSEVEVSAVPDVSDFDEVDGIAIPETLPEALLEEPLQPSKAAEEAAAPPGSPKAPSSIESLSSLSDEAEPTPKLPAPTPQAPPTPAATQEEPAFVTPALFATLSTRPSTRPKKPSQRAQLSKVVISSAHHAAAAAEAEAKRLREDQEQQGLIVVARRRTQQAAAGAARGRGPSVFPPGSKLEALTRYGVEEDQQKLPKPVDYMDPLYTISSYTVPVGDLIRKASKTVTTANYNLDHNDRIAQKVLKKIEELRSKGLWSFEQIRKAPEPPRKMAHWDYLLKEMNWLSVDYREERRLKIAEAKMLADLVKEYHESTTEQRAEMVVDRKKFGIVPKGIREQRRKRQSIADCSDQPTPELMESGGTPEEEDAEEYFVKQEAQDDTVMDLDDDTGMYDHLNEPPPASVFALRPDETSFFMPKTKAAKDLLEELPLFAPPAPPPNGAEFIWEDAWSKNGIIPVSKYSLGRMEFSHEDRPLRKRKRYEYEVNSEPFADDSDEEGDVVGGSPAYDSYGRPKSRDKSSRPLPLHPEQNNVALFRPEFKPTLQRIRNHVFRPPMDQPPQAFFESRNPSLWTADEDEKLRLLTKEYNFNWQLVSVYMDMEGEYHSGAERRSPWECFERWMSIENVPPDFNKSPWYKGVQQRLEIAQRSSQQHIQAAASGSQHVNTLKRRGTLPTKVDRRRATRTFTQMEAMRKLSKKRETTLTKQAQSNRGLNPLPYPNPSMLTTPAAAQVAAMRKQSSNTNNSQLRTPQYFSTMKHEKDIKAMEQKALMAQMGRGQVSPAFSRNFLLYSR